MHVVDNVITKVLIWRRREATACMQQKRVKKRPSKFFHRRLCTCDVAVRDAFVVKFIDERELHVAVYPGHKLWRFFKCESKLPSLLNYFGQNFCHLLENHLTAPERLRAGVARPGVSICDARQIIIASLTHTPTVHHKWICPRRAYYPQNPCMGALT